MIDHPFRRDGLWARTWPFAGALALAFAMLPLIDEILRPTLVAVAGAVAVATALGVALLPWERLPRALSVLPPLAVVAITFLLQRGTGRLGDPVDFEGLLLLPVLWLAVYGTRAEMLMAIAAATASFAASIALAAEPSDAWVKVVMWPAVASLVCLRVRALVERVHHLSSTDALTGLTNRTKLQEELEREAARSSRNGAPLALAVLDLDHFKRVNDDHGHEAGDALLRACADAWASQLRAGDLLARYGGEEFVAVLPETGARAAREAAERLRQATPGGATCSVGVAVRAPDEPVDRALSRADAALYRAKAAGRDRVVADAFDVPIEAGAPSSG